MIEEKVNEFEDDAEGMKFRLLGEVQAIRAMSYWYLINMYGEPWRSEEQAKTAMGVPVNTETSIVDKTYVRETLAKNYELSLIHIWEGVLSALLVTFRPRIGYRHRIHFLSDVKD